MYFQAAMAGFSALSSLMGNSQANKNLYRQQLAIVAGQKSRDVQLTDKMQETIRAGGVIMSAKERENMKAVAKQTASRATSNTAGASAAYAFLNMEQQLSFTKGTIASKRDSSLREDGRVSQKYANQAAGQINIAESKKKSGVTMIMEAAVAGASAYSEAGDFKRATKKGGPVWLQQAVSW